ncbi:MAG: polysaccharide lyase [Pirellulaceae bacterium]|nr:MAG: polysaccharide lyase [Pirellulaceae bacterium]
MSPRQCVKVLGAWSIGCWAWYVGISLAATQDGLVQEARVALRRAVTFFHEQVAVQGGYVYRYSQDLQKREGEGRADAQTVWVQPPGTPAVGLAYLEAYRLTGEPRLLQAAQDAADCLIKGQLWSGGWTNHITFAPQERRRYAYRVDGPPSDRAFNWSTLDDNISQSATRFLMQLDQQLQFRDSRLHEAALLALESILKAQYPNGAWPQGFREPAAQDTERYPIIAARFPDQWSRQFVKQDYWVFYTLNDNALADTIELMLAAAEIYANPAYRQAALRAGQFLILAQLPEPQPAWAQQYDFQMYPTWARKFEPPAVTGGESQGVIRVLMRLYEETGDKRFLEPIPKALDYLARSTLPNGRLARFYELRTNRPLFFDRNYQLTYDSSNVPTHYGFEVDSGVESLRREYERLVSLSAAQLEERRLARRRVRLSRPSDDSVRRVIRALDERGAWVENGRLRYHGADDTTQTIISSQTFIRNLDILARFLAAHAPAAKD